MIAVVAIADAPIARAGLESILRSRETLQVVGSFSTFAASAELLEELQPDVVLLEWSFSDSEPPFEKLLAPRSLHGNPALVILADNFSGDWAIEALRSGVRGILPRSASPIEIVSAVEASAAGVAVLHAEVVDSLLSVLPASSREKPTFPMQALTAREIEVLGMLAEGLGNKAIAKRLNISEHTVKFHVSSIFQKLGVSTRTEAVTLGARLGLVML